MHMDIEKRLGMIDVHAHLASGVFADVDNVIARAINSGVKKIVISITHPREYLLAKTIVDRHPGSIFLTIGFDPCCSDQALYDQFVLLASSSPAVGIGEVGLDNYYIRDVPQMAAQEARFKRAITIAKARDLPLVIHSRSAGKKALELLRLEGAEKVLMHAFDGKAGDAMNATKNGYFFSIPTSVVHSEQKRKLARLLPLESMMLETDSPVLAPVRGEVNEPANLIQSAEAISIIKHVSIQEVIKVTSSNASRFFKLEK